MSHKEIESAVEALIQPVLEKKGIEVVDVEYVRERNWILRIFIDKDGGVDLNDCQEISVSAGELIDKNDVISDNYMLEVSSPGIDRVLKKDKDFIRYKDSKVSVKLFAPVEELNLDKEFAAILNGLVNDEISLILDDGREIFLSKKKISQMRLYFEF